MSIEQIVAKIEENDMYLALFEGEEQHAELVAALIEDNKKLRAEAAKLGVFLV